MAVAATQVKQFRLRAAEVRRIAEGIADPACRQNLIGIAEHYERLAAMIELRAFGPGFTTSIH